MLFSARTEEITRLLAKVKKIREDMGFLTRKEERYYERQAKRKQEEKEKEQAMDAGSDSDEEEEEEESDDEAMEAEAVGV